MRSPVLTVLPRVSFPASVTHVGLRHHLPPLASVDVQVPSLSPVTFQGLTELSTSMEGPCDKPREQMSPHFHSVAALLLFILWQDLS